MDSTVQVALIGVLSFAVSALAMPIIRRIAVARGAVVAAREDRWHTQATPAFGGVGIFLAFVVGVAVAWYLDVSPSAWFYTTGYGLPPVLALLLGAVGMFATGLADDLWDLRPVTKLVLQLAAASVLVSGGLVVHLTGTTVIDVVVTVCWFVAITNAVNLLDNMNGLAAGVSVIAASYLGILLSWDGLAAQSAVAFALTGATAGFLIHNYPKAKIFMGDGGSLFIGILLAGLGLSPSPGLSRGLFAVVGVPFLVLAVPILDTMLVTVSRLAEGRPVSQGGRDHASHRLVAVGISERRAVRLLWLFAVLSGSVALVFRTSEASVAYLLGGLVLLILASVAFYLLGIQVRERVAGKTILARIFEANQHWPVLAVGLDVLAIAIAYYGAYLVRWEGSELAAELPYFKASLPVLIPVKIAALGAFRVYRSPLRHFSLGDAERVLLGNVIGSVFAFMITVMVLGFGFSRGVVALDFLLALALTVGFRLSVRMLDRLGERWHDDAKPAVIIGTQKDALLVLGELRVEGIRDLRPDCLLSPAAHGGPGFLRGMPVRSGPGRCREWLKNHSVSAAFVVRRDAGLDPDVTALLEECLETGIAVHFLEVKLSYMKDAPTLRVVRPPNHESSAGVANGSSTG